MTTRADSFNLSTSSVEACHFGTDLDVSGQGGSRRSTSGARNIKNGSIEEQPWRSHEQNGFDFAGYGNLAFGYRCLNFHFTVADLRRADCKLQCRTNLSNRGQVAKVCCFVSLLGRCARQILRLNSRFDRWRNAGSPLGGRRRLLLGALQLNLPS